MNVHKMTTTILSIAIWRLYIYMDIYVLNKYTLFSLIHRKLYTLTVDSQH